MDNKWDDKYRLLAEGEIVEATDETLHDSKGWIPVVNSIGDKAPSPLYTSHRKFRRLKNRPPTRPD